MEYAFLILICLAVCSKAGIIITAGPEPHEHQQVQDLIRNSSENTWCRPGTIRQIVAENNCESVELENKVCLGSCLSYSVPRTLPRANHEVVLNHCETCQSNKFHWVNVTLSCSQKDETYTMVKTVQKIESCECRDCPNPSRNGDISLIDQKDHFPQVMTDSNQKSNPLSLTSDSQDLLVASNPDPESLQSMKDIPSELFTNRDNDDIIRTLGFVKLDNLAPLAYDRMENTQDNSGDDLADIYLRLPKIPYRSLSIGEVRNRLSQSD